MKKNVSKKYLFKPSHILMFFYSFIIFVALAIYLTYPLILHMGSLVTAYGDEFVTAWIQNWVIHSLTTNPFGIWNTNTYFPYHGTWGFSDLFITTSLLGFIPMKLIGQPIATFNFTVISSLALLGFSLFLLSYYLTKDFLASLFCGVLVICSPVVLDKNVHTQILAIEFIPFSILSFMVFIRSKKSRYQLLAMIFFVMQTLNSFMSGYFLVFFYLVYVIYYWFCKRSNLKLFFTKQSVVIYLLTALFLAPFILAYFQVSREFSYVRPIRETIHFALQPEDFIYPGVYSKLAPLLRGFSDIMHYRPASGEVKPGYLGLVFSLLSILCVGYFAKNIKKKDPVFTIFITTGLLGIVLSLGPFLHFGRVTIHKPFPIPLPYAIFYYVFPGFQAFRDSERWEMLFVICGSVAIAIMLVKLLKRFSNLRKTVIYLLLIAGALFEFDFPMKFLPVTQASHFPAVYQWLKTTPKNTSLIFMPIYNWNMPGADIEMRREYYSTIEFRPMVNGYSGFSPIPWQDLIYFLQKKFPNTQSVKRIQNLGVQFIIIDKIQYDKDFQNHLLPVDGSQTIQTLVNNPSLRFIGNVSEFYIFEFKTKTDSPK